MPRTRINAGSSPPQRFWQLFWQRPRPHGEQRPAREVSFLELFYDLVYVVLVSQAASSLAHDVSWRAFGNYAVVFSLVWIAWVNGTWYHELHAREDGRSRVALFAQMLVIAPLAAFTRHAAGADGRAFALTYAALMLLFMWLWWSVRRVDAPEHHGATAVYLATMAATTALMAVSAYLGESARMLVWAAYVVVWSAGVLAMRRVATRRVMGSSVAVTPSMVERFDLLVIIVLGEVVVGVVNGLGTSPHAVGYVVTALAGMLVAFGLWWMYFDFAGQRYPRDCAQFNWVMSHLPLTLGIAAVGACTVHLVERATGGHVSASTAWITATSFAITVAALITRYVTLEDARRHAHLYRKLVIDAAFCIPLAFVIAAFHPTPIILLLLLALLLTVLWWLSMLVWMRSDTTVRSWPPGLHRHTE